jgi:hypothetical protein
VLQAGPGQIAYGLGAIGVASHRHGSVRGLSRGRLDRDGNALHGRLSH